MKYFLLLLMFIFYGCLGGTHSTLIVNDSPLVVVDKFESSGRYGTNYYIKCFTGKDVITYYVSQYDYNNKIHVQDTLKSYIIR